MERSLRVGHSISMKSRSIGAKQRREARRAIQAALRHYFEPLEQEPVPERLLQLLDLIEQREIEGDQCTRSPAPRRLFD
jgi:Anti-sigma factor NepR